MTRLLAPLLLAGALPAATVLSSFREGSSLFLRLSDGTAQVDWLSDSSFHFARRWDGNFARGPARKLPVVDFKLSDAPRGLRVATKYLVLTIARTGVTAQVAEPDGTPIMTDASEAERRDGAVVWERMAGAETRFFGLGAREDSAIELRGTRTAAIRPFLISSAGYGEFHIAPAKYTFDLARAKPDRYRIEARGADRVEYYFFFGPAPKEILEQYLLVDGPMEPLSPEVFRPLAPSELPSAATALTSRTLSGMIHGLINGSLSGLLLPALPLDPYLGAPDTVRRRAIQLASVMPIVFGSRPDWLRGSWREKLPDYFNVYAEEARDRGLPLIHALPMQYPKDAEAARIDDEFMLGDELLVAPLAGASNSRSVYLPMGIWTRLSDDQVFSGKHKVSIDSPDGELPLFSRNGAILPLGSNPMVLHYFPKLGGEFFLFESDLADYSQIHAAPAGDFLRLEIESKKQRDYDWVVHHLDRPRGVEGFSGSWSYDSAARQLHVRTRVQAGEDQIVNISF